LNRLNNTPSVKSLGAAAEPVAVNIETPINTTGSPITPATISDSSLPANIGSLRST
jgi:hypothetical protein